MASIDFMVCIAMERYSLIISARCSCFRQAMETSVVVCFVFWAPSLFWLFRVTSLGEIMSNEINIIIVNILLLLPFPLLMFFLVGTLKFLSAASSIPPDEKHRTVAVLVLVLLIYTLMILPYIIWSLATGPTPNAVTFTLSTIIHLIPLASIGVYFFLRKGAVDKLLASVCCCRMDHSEISSRVNDDTGITVSSV
ncbi:hypothetical protein EXN66_Car001057 [Channa argus]|uniref:G-protein coupled receptors family 1 profile domain-containing protein n=2 Tax=Channa argus TaxID=215402 RepID=A0A6G1QZH0_CHAAH|nr:hypothetical protein EXN66_Car001057 [Channa argus]